MFASSTGNIVLYRSPYPYGLPFEVQLMCMCCHIVLCDDPHLHIITYIVNILPVGHGALHVIYDSTAEYPLIYVTRQYYVDFLRLYSRCALHTRNAQVASISYMSIVRSLYERHSLSACVHDQSYTRFYLVDTSAESCGLIYYLVLFAISA